MSMKEFPDAWSGLWSVLFPLGDVSKTNHLIENSQQPERRVLSSNQQSARTPWDRHRWGTMASPCQRQKITRSHQGQRSRLSAEMNQPQFLNTAHTLHTSGRSNLIFLIPLGNGQNNFGQNLVFPLQSCRLGLIKWALKLPVK